ncbi:hypothetical protein [Halalkalibacter flavus]|uniref:hypothetical protein n=1 Tax=Halalkalibacter flavus TaxID=3090668 RepID=UPI002FC9AD61
MSMKVGLEMINPKLKEIEKSWLLDATIEEIQKKMESKEVSAKELVFILFKSNFSH